MCDKDTNVLNKTDFISREAAIRAHCDGCVDDGYCGKLDGRYACEDVPQIMAIPAADVRPVVHGEWIVDSIASNIFRCSVCGQDAPVEPTGGTEYKSNFCSNCGADMREVKKAMRSNLLMNCLWYEDISPDELTNILELTPYRLFDKIFGNEEFTPEEIHKIVGLLGLTEEETNTIFYSQEV